MLILFIRYALFSFEPVRHRYPDSCGLLGRTRVLRVFKLTMEFPLHQARMPLIDQLAAELNTFVANQSRRAGK